MVILISFGFGVGFCFLLLTKQHDLLFKGFTQRPFCFSLTVLCLDWAQLAGSSARLAWWSLRGFQSGQPGLESSGGSTGVLEYLVPSRHLSVVYRPLFSTCLSPHGLSGLAGARFPWEKEQKLQAH